MRSNQVISICAALLLAGLTGCNASPPQSEPTATNGSTSPVLTRSYGDVTIVTTQSNHSNGCVSFASAVYNQAGVELFDTETSEFCEVLQPNPPTVRWMWLTSGTSNTMQIGDSGKVSLPTIEGLNIATSMLFTNVPESADAEPFNQAGCDSNHFFDCAPTGPGACCDVHDQCYYDHNCSSRSWHGWEGLDCLLCNAMVFACYLRVGQFLDFPGPSICCALGNCKEETCAMKNNVPIIGPACNGKCFDPMTDADNCGHCGNKCPGGSKCEGGSCQPSPCPTCPMGPMCDGAIGGCVEAFGPAFGYSETQQKCQEQEAYVQSVGAIVVKSCYQTAYPWGGCGTEGYWDFKYVNMIGGELHGYRFSWFCLNRLGW